VAAEHQVELAFIQPGKPAQNGYVERFNRTFREEVLDAYIFSNLREIREMAIDWMEEYNVVRPHEALKGLTPYEFSAANAA
jgi:putative transposase